MTASISPGSSGGPVLNSNGELLGISVSQLSDGQNLNFAIPKSYLQILLDFKKDTPMALSTLGKPIRIGSIEVAQNYFPKIMDWDDAVKACTDLGNGWRLPTKYELNLMYLNKDKIGDFANSWYWSSTEYSNGNAWCQYFVGGTADTYAKNYGCYVRAVRSF